MTTPKPEPEFVPIDDTVTILLGAGASHDCGDSDTAYANDRYKPPLVDHLFRNHGEFNAVLAKYPGAVALSDEIRSRLLDRESLEDILGDLAQHPRLNVRRRVWEVALYLQELLGEVSQHYVPDGATKFNTMLLALMKSHFRNVLLLTVNYDTLLERAIKGVFRHEFRAMDDYRWSEEDGRQWALVKLHGSTTWGRRLRCKAGAEHWADLVGDLTDLDMEPDFIPLASHQGQHRLVGGHYCYPALALPLGGKSNFVCPSEHLELANGMLKDSSHLLVIGFSGLDQHVLQMLRQADRMLTVKIVDKGPSAEHVLARFKRVGPAFEASPKEILYLEGFRQFVRSRELHRVLGVRGPTVVPMDPGRRSEMSA